MKKIFFLCICFNVQFFITSQEQLIEHKEYWYAADYFIHLYIYSDKIIYRDEYSGNQSIELSKDSYCIDNDGYLTLSINKDSYQYKKVIFIDGDNQYEVFKRTIDEYINFFNHRQYKDAYLYKNIFTQILSSKYLVEKIRGNEIKYSPDNLYKLYLYPQDKGTPPDWNFEHIPWVEGENDSGIGANIQICFSEAVESISILNGYVDLSKKYLFYQNNRVKKMRIIDNDTNDVYILIFEDYVYFNSIKFERNVRNITIYIDEIYNGTKYNDTCITAIIPHE